MDGQKMIEIDTTLMPWEERFQAALGKSNFRRLLLQDPDTGMEVRLLRYPAGFTATWHTHNCAHGMYVLEGTLVTHRGDSFSPEGINERFRSLSKREAEVCSLVARRWNTHEIAAQLFVSPRTIEKHMEGIFLKLDVRSRDQLRWRLGVAPPGGR